MSLLPSAIIPITDYLHLSTLRADHRYYKTPGAGNIPDYGQNTFPTPALPGSGYGPVVLSMEPWVYSQPVFLRHPLSANVQKRENSKKCIGYSGEGFIFDTRKSFAMYKVKVNNNTFEVALNDDQLLVNDEPLNWDISMINSQSFHIIKDSVSYRADLVKADYKQKSLIIKINGNKYEIELKDKFDLLLEKLGMDAAASAQLNDVKAPMPGLIFEVNVSEGDEVKKGDPIMILEAMKMENVIKAAGDGVVKSVKVKKGDSVEKNQVLVQF